MDDFLRGVSVLLKLFFYLMFFGTIAFFVFIAIWFVWMFLVRVAPLVLVGAVAVTAVYWIVKLIGIIARKLS